MNILEEQGDLCPSDQLFNKEMEETGNYNAEIQNMPAV